VIFSFRQFAVISVLAASVLLSPVAHAAAPAFVSDEDVFKALREAGLRDDAVNAEKFAARLPGYSIPSYVDYYRLRPRLRVASAAEVRDFLQRYAGSAIADRLRNDWLLELGNRREWAAFDEQYPLFVVADDLQLKCYALMSRAIKGQNVAEDARTLLTSPKDYGNPCSTLIAVLAQNGQFTSADVWAQMRLAGETGATQSAKRLAPLVGVTEKAIEQAIEKPALIVTKGPERDPASHQLFIIALGRSAKSGAELAVHALNRAAENLSPAERALGWAQIALQSSYKLAPETLRDYWSRAADAPLSTEGHEWKVRMALRAGDWKKVKAGIEAMPPSIRVNSTWVYWMARALREEGRNDEATALFRSIAEGAHFYGQLALEELGQKISVPLAAQPISAAELAPIAANPGLRRALQFFRMNLRFEGVREWNWELRKMSDREILAAAEFARQNDLLDRMVNTSDRTKTELDFTQRFPSPFRDFMYRSTNALGLDMAWVYGLIRQESRFIQNARSHVGASGLMQLMPATANWVARKIGMTGFEQARVNDTDTNIQLGTNYLNMVLKDLDGSQAMATAAYNAGPGRPRAWRSTLTRSVEGAIFAETIPFNETRGYVKNVLSNATYYAALFESKPQSLKARLGTVAPKGYAATELP